MEQVLLELAKGRYFVPGFCPKSSLPSIAAVCFLPTGAKATCISPQRAVFEKTLAALDPIGCLTIYIFSNVILSPYLLTLTITTQVCEKQNKKKKASFFCQQECDEVKLAVCWGRRVAPGLVLDAHASELQYSSLLSML